MRQALRQTATRCGLLLLGLLSCSAGWAQRTVPAILDTYRADPTEAAAVSVGTVSLSAAQARELYFESFIAGYMQGTPANSGAYGADSAWSGVADANNTYPVMTQRMAPTQRLPRMPITVDDNGDVILYLRIYKLPTKTMCQSVVDYLAANGLIAEEDNPTTAAPVATGRWRVLVYPPTGKGAPPAPSLFYPEALRLLHPTDDPATTLLADDGTALDAIQRFWGAEGTGNAGGLFARLMLWSDYFKGLYDQAIASPQVGDDTYGGSGEVITGEDKTQNETKLRSRGLQAVPRFVPDPGFQAKLAGATVDRTATADRDAVNGLQFFDPDTLWENQVTDPDQVVAQEVTTLEDNLPAALADAETHRPIEIPIYADETAYASDGNWYLSGIYTAAREMYDNAANADAAIPSECRATTDANGLLAAPIDLAINLQTGQWRVASDPADTFPHGTPRRVPLAGGVGMVELQFEYETSVVADSDAPAYNINPTGMAGGNGFLFGDDEVFGGTNGPNPGDPQDADDPAVTAVRAAIVGGTPTALPLNKISYGVTELQDGRSGGGFKALRDPLDLDRTKLQNGASAPDFQEWRIRRYSGWPFNPAVPDYPNAATRTLASYQGGPIVCRFVVGGLQVLPQDERANPTGALQADYYDPPNDRFYPQVELNVPQELWRPTFLLGYGGDTTPIEDFFFPIRPGSQSGEHKFYVKTVVDPKPGGRVVVWNDDGTVGHPFVGPADLGSATSGEPSWYSFEIRADDANSLNDLRLDYTDPASDPNPNALLYAYDLKGDNVYSGSTQTAPGNVTYEDGYGYDNAAGTQREWFWDVRRAFDGDLDPTAPTDPNDSPQAVVKDGFRVGVEFDNPTDLDRVEIYYHDDAAGALATSDWTLEYLDGTGWHADSATLLGTIARASGNSWVWCQPALNVAVQGYRVINSSGKELVLDELRLLTKADLRHEVLTPPDSTAQSVDLDIVPQPLSSSSIQMAASRDRIFDTVGTSTIQSTLRVNVPPRQPPSRDAVQRQLLVDENLAPGGYSTNNQVEPRYGSATWDRYRGTVAVYLDDGKSRAKALDDDESSRRSRELDADLYLIKYREPFDANGDGSINAADAYPGTSQFVRWYEEDTGRIGEVENPIGSGDYVADLEAIDPARQRVAIEDYATFDVEFSVAYERRLRIAEKLLDFGKAIPGGLSQWVPLTLVNEGNVPLRSLKLFLDLPLTPIDLADEASDARLAQSLAVPSWHFNRLALGANGANGTELGSAQWVVYNSTSSAWETGQQVAEILPAAVGSPTGRPSEPVYVRVGRLDTSPYRLVPIGQPVGNYRGSLQVFTDDRGVSGSSDGKDENDNVIDLNDQPDDPDETSFASGTELKLTVQETPLARLSDYWDNEVDRRDDPAVDLMPYDAGSGFGTYQPIPVFDFRPTAVWDSSLDAETLTDPQRSDATPAIFVQQTPSEMTADPPNASDRLVAVWSTYRERAATATGANAPSWRLFWQAASRAGLASASELLQSNYRSFRWPDPATQPVEELSPTAGQPYRERNLYPSICAIPGTDPAEYFVVWHNEREGVSSEQRVNALELVHVSGTGTPSAVQELTDDASGQNLVKKQVPRAKVLAMDGETHLWVAWQSTATGGSQLGFNALNLTGSDPVTYVDAIDPTAPAVVNYQLRTPPGLLNVAEPWLLPSYRHETTNLPWTAARYFNVFYSGWSPIRGNQDIYWGRYQPYAPPADPAVAADPTLVQQAPMAEDAFRFGDATGSVATDPTEADAGYTVLTQPGGRLPFPRITNELLTPNANHTVFASSGVDWMMPGDRPRVSSVQTVGAGTTQAIEAWNHRGFADTGRPLVDLSRLGVLDGSVAADPDLDPLVILRVHQAASMSELPPANPQIGAERVGFALDRATWDPGTNEWVLPVNSPSWLIDLGVNTVRVQPGLGRVTFNKPLYRAGSQVPVFLFATYRPCTWPLTDDPGTDSQPTAAYDAWERLTVAWRRADQGGKGRLWYRTFSLVVPLLQAPATAVEAVVNDDSVQGDQTFDDDAELQCWTFTGVDGAIQSADLTQANRAWSGISVGATSQGFSLGSFGSNSTSSTTAQAGVDAAGMLWFGWGDTGRRVRVWYQTTTTDPASRIEEAAVVPGFGQERLVPLDGSGDESQPCLAAESFHVGYRAPAQAAVQQILTTRLWLAWTSTRDLYVHGADGATPAAPGAAGTNLYYAALLPDFSPPTTAR